MNSFEFKQELPDEYVSVELREARELLADAQHTLDELRAGTNTLIEEYDRAVIASGSARRAYGASPSKKLATEMHKAEQLVTELSARHEALELEIEEESITLETIKAECDRLESEALAAYRAAEHAEIEAAGRELARLLSDTVAAAPQGVLTVAGAAIDARTRDTLLDCLGIPERFRSIGRAA